MNEDVIVTEVAAGAYVARPEYVDGTRIERVLVLADGKRAAYVDIATTGPYAGFIFFAFAWLRGQGHGTSAYLAALERVGCIRSHGCSDSALRVWESLGRRPDLTIEHGDGYVVARRHEAA